MPTKEEKKRGVLRYRTIKPTPNTYIHIAIVRKAGPRGGKTIAGKVKKDKLPYWRPSLLMPMRKVKV